MSAICRDQRLRSALFAAAAIFACALFVQIAWPFSCYAREAKFLVAHEPLILADWQSPLSLPLRFRNHCGFAAFGGHFYCANHCGHDYQFYYCSRASFGCCQIGRGYCGWDGALRCAP